MKAIILAAGVGRRLHEVLDGLPKCLLVFDGEPLIGRLLDGLDAAGVDEAVVVVGYGAAHVRGRIGNARGRLRVRYVDNPAYTKGAILSLWCARADLTGDVLVMDADVLCAQRLLDRLVGSPHANCVLLDGGVAPSGEEQMLMARGGRVYDIAKTCTIDPTCDTAGESVGFLKVSAADAPVLREVLETAVAAGRDDIEHEQVFPEFMRRCVVGYERVDGVPWIEIDFPQDVAVAEREVLPRIRAADAAARLPHNVRPKMR
jgi:choline kinase